MRKLPYSRMGIVLQNKEKMDTDIFTAPGPDGRVLFLPGGDIIIENQEG